MNTALVLTDFAREPIDWSHCACRKALIEAEKAEFYFAWAMQHDVFSEPRDRMNALARFHNAKALMYAKLMEG